MSRPKETVNEERLRTIVPTVYSYRQVLLAFGYKGEGGNYRIVKRQIKDLNLDISHFKNQGWNKGQSFEFKPRRSTEDLLKFGSNIGSHKLKKRLLRDKLIDNKCFVCNISSWLEKPLSLHLDHIDGNNENNVLSNLRLLCPNCHSQTETYCGKNKGKTGAPTRSRTGMPEGAKF